MGARQLVVQEAAEATVRSAGVRYLSRLTPQTNIGVSSFAGDAQQHDDLRAGVQMRLQRLSAVRNLPVHSTT